MLIERFLKNILKSLILIFIFYRKYRTRIEQFIIGLTDHADSKDFSKPSSDLSLRVCVHCWIPFFFFYIIFGLCVHALHQIYVFVCRYEFLLIFLILEMWLITIPFEHVQCDLFSTKVFTLLSVKSGYFFNLIRFWILSAKIMLGFVQ